MGIERTAINLMDRLEATKALDKPAAALADLGHALTRQRVVRKALSGTYAGHRLHPTLVTVPIGSWVGAALLDALPDERARFGADAMITLGVIATLPTAAAGLNDYADTIGGQRRVGAVHATANTVALTFYVGSLAARLGGRRGLGRALAAAGLTAVGLGGYLGGHLSYVQGVWIDRRAYLHPPADWTPVVPEANLPQRTPTRVTAGDDAVLLYRDGGEIFALANTCGHAGGPLDEGKVEGGCVTCPWHGSTFRLRDGAVVDAPASGPQFVYQTRVHNGMVEVRSGEPTK